MKMKKKWWKEAVVYQVYPRSFQDSNGDGVGDIKGIINRLPYIRDLGANVIWVSPVYQSPMDDNGYDISDYYHIDPRFGTDEDMDLLIEKANKAGIKILMDLVLNHTSDEHEWFQKALEEPQGKYGDYYVFADGINGGPPNNWRSYFGSSAWEQVKNTNRYYLHAFGKKQPDLNWENPQVREELYRMVNYWLDKGVGGFRIDAIGNIKKNIQIGNFPQDGEDGLCFIGNWILNQPGIELFLKELNERTFKLHNSMTVAEANVPEHLLRQFIGEEGFFSMVFDFSYTDLDVPVTGEWFKPVPWTTEELRDLIFKAQMDTQLIGWSTSYLENHDQPRSLNKYIKEGDINYYSVTMLAALFLLLRGTPFIYQGQEIGMTNISMDKINDYVDIATYDQYERAQRAGCSKEEALRFMYQRSRDNSRTPMQWESSENAGFTQSDHTWIKINPNYQEINVQKQEKQSQSVLQFYRNLIALRTKGEFQDVLVHGSFIPCYPEDKNIISYKRKIENREILVILNYSGKEKKFLQKGIWKNVVIDNYGQVKNIAGGYHLRAYEAIVLTR